MMKGYRKAVLVEPRIQLKLAISCFLVGFAAVVVQSIVFGGLLLHAMRHGTAPDEALGIANMLTPGILASLTVLLPGALAVGVLGVFRVMGPLRNFRTFLAEVVTGERSAPCRIRKKDELQDLCDLMNESTRPLRRGNAPIPPSSHEIVVPDLHHPVDVRDTGLEEMLESSTVDEEVGDTDASTTTPGVLGLGQT